MTIRSRVAVALVGPLRWDEYDDAPCCASLRAIKFDKRISVEASAKDFPSEAPQAIALLRRALRGDSFQVDSDLTFPRAPGRAVSIGVPRGTRP
jgi:hypothetical protein